MSTPSVHLAVLVVATDPAKADLATAMVIRGRATGAGHQIVQQTVTKDMEAGIRSQLARWIDDRNIDVILITGAVESDVVAAAIKPLITLHLPGFTDLFRYLAFQELGAGAMLSNAEAAQCNSTYLFVLPGSAGAVGTAMDKLILPQLDPNTKPKNLIDSMPGLKERADAVPKTIISEKTSGGAGIVPKLPASPGSLAQPVVRSKPPTGRNVVRRADNDPPTRQVDIAKLERLAKPNEAQTKPNIDLRKMLPKRPPGADEDSDTETDILAAPPPILSDKRADTSPVALPPVAIPAPGEAPPRPKTPTGQRVGRPITVPPTSAFAPGTRAGTTPGTAPPPTAVIPKKESTEPGAVMPSRRPADSGKQAISSGVPTASASKKETGRVAPPPPPKDAFAPRQKTTTGAAPVVTIPPATKKPTGSVPITKTPTGSVPVTPPARATQTTKTPASGLPITKPLAPKTPATDLPVTTPLSAKQPAAHNLPTTPIEKLTREQPSAPISSGMLTPSASSMFAAAAEPAATETKPENESSEGFVKAIEQEVAKARAPMNGAAKAASMTPSVEMAPILDAQLEEEPAKDAQLEEEPAKPAPPPKPRAPTPTPPPPVVVQRDSAADLPVGTFSYPEKRRKKSNVGTILALLVAGGIGFAAVVYVVPRFTEKHSQQTAQVEKPTPPAPPPVIEQQAPLPAVDTPPPPPSEDKPPVVDTPPPPPSDDKPPATKPTTTKPTTKPVTKPDTGAVTKPDTKPETKPETKPDTKPQTKPDTPPPPPPPADDGCDEVGCVLSKYDRPCCERYKPQSNDLKPRTGGIPEELDRAMVRSGVEKVKPAVVQCGEKAGVKGTVKIAVEVAPEGNVTSAEVSESPDAALGTCVATALKKAKFGKSVNGGSFTYPFVF